MKRNVKPHRFPYEWTLKDAVFTKDKGKVFSCFACGGGSTMGYKLAGFDVIGCNEIDPKMMEAYITNHCPKYAYLEPIQTFKLRKDLPDELYDLDILDGSPPCSSFSMAGNREKDWGKDKVFREGQSMQILDTLFFDFIDLAKELKPKVVVAENVKGLLLGAAKSYVIQIYKEFDKAGYYVQHFLLDASKMGVPQKRERVFFIALRKDIAGPFLYSADMFRSIPRIEMDFKEKPIVYGDIQTNNGPSISEFYKTIWEQRKPGDLDFSCVNSRVRNKPNTGFGQNFIYKDKVVGTLTAKADCMVKFDYPQYLSNEERCKIGTFPLDYDFSPSNNPYLIGMSVPPVMTAQIASNIYDQWLSELSKEEAA
ncbi:DNA cytosine methyltransferase [Pedobacter faecalis]|uniref:DNA cytosine methyltransferase n=1 Tax=Pedobacter faecalis TaxID=3041495 RepID=UPI002549E86A|nr:DNA cytosine methyltransferase [Pedobacter sp. ELA7]